jgi:SAM-dependent methyltransferase
VPWAWAIVSRIRYWPGLYWLWQRSFPGSERHWQRHYDHGGNSGPGSYGDFAEYKARLVNQAIAENEIRSIIELGCGDGNQLSYLNIKEYIGLDVSKVAIELCCHRYAGDPTRSFIWYDPRYFQDPLHFVSADCAMSLDVIFHLIEHHVFARYIRNLFDCGRRFVIIYGLDRDENQRGHASVRYRRYSEHISRNIHDFRIAKHVPAHEKYGDFFLYERIETQLLSSACGRGR